MMEGFPTQPSLSPAAQDRPNTLLGANHLGSWPEHQGARAGGLLHGAPPMPASSMVPHIKTLLMCDVAYVNKEGIGAKVPARLSLEASSPTVPLLSHPCPTNSLPTETKDPREISKDAGVVPTD
ncbi:hypothetical protein XENOCAPTIV_016969 [Xenoophorus captivus]|uniref:Uncharacterized protein n=1 Tax=Xenoophorus captivus TaxID=1517983 RepID=A0ABV0SHH6_9TELE